MRRLWQIGGVIPASLLLAPVLLSAQAATQFRAIRIDREGVIRWSDTNEEVALYGANYILPSASDYRAAGYVTRDRKKLIDQDMAHFARMGWNGLRLTLWGDWENSDRAGNLIVNEHLDLLDYLIARARERGIYMLLSPIQTYNAGWPDALHDTTAAGFSNHFQKSELGTRAEAIAAQVNYLKQLLEHVNPYTGVALKNEPAILFIEPINEPHHHPEDLEGSVRYINALVDAVRSTGARQPVFHNVSQDFRIGDAIRRSKAQGVSFGWYPTGLNSGRTLQGNHLRSVDAFPDLLRAELKGLPRIVYEFDSADLATGYMYPAMVRTFRTVGAQFVAMFSYDMLATASRNLGWQTHYLNLVSTPRKAMSAIIAGEAMRRLPRMRTYGAYPQNTRFGDFRVSYEQNTSELVTRDVFLYAADTDTKPPEPARLNRIAGYGSSPIVQYDGQGIYFLDRLSKGVWRLELYPDALAVNDPFEMQSPDKIVTRAIYRSWPMTIELPDLGASFTVQPLSAESPDTQHAQAGRFTASPGVYILSATGPVERNTLPSTIGYLKLDEFHAPPPDELPTVVTHKPVGQHVAGRLLEIHARVVATTPPERVTLSIRTAGQGAFRPHVMQFVNGYDYSVAIPANALREGPYEYVITIGQGDSVITFPERLRKSPQSWDYHGRASWKLFVVSPTTPLRLFVPSEDVPQLAFTRIGDAGRRGIYRVVPSPVTGAPLFHLELPVYDSGYSPEDYTASLTIKDRIAARQETIADASGLMLRMRGLGPQQTFHITLVERDGTSWSAALRADSTWREHTVVLTELRIARGVLLPNGFPGNWNYWVEPAAGRGGPQDRIRWAELERIQFSLRREEGVPLTPGSYGIEIESAVLLIESTRPVGFMPATAGPVFTSLLPADPAIVSPRLTL